MSCGVVIVSIVSVSNVVFGSCVRFRCSSISMMVMLCSMLKLI